MNQKAIFVAVCGSPNAGKSSIINKLVGTKISIVSPKPQTTVELVRGIAVYEETQAIFIDTPGIFEPRQQKYKKMVRHAWDGVREADITLFVHDATSHINMNIIKRLEVQNKPVIVALDKMDLLKKLQLLPIMAKLSEYPIFKEIFPISAKNGEGLDALIAYIKSQAKEAEWPFSAEQSSDQNDRDFAAEVTREKLFLMLSQELPYSVKVVTELYKEEENEPIEIHQSIIVAKESQKKIIIGDKASMIKKIGESARKDLQRNFGQGVRLFLNVKCSKNLYEME